MTTGLGAGQACAQAIERNPPRSEARPDVAIVPPALTPQEDPTPIGPKLNALVTIGGRDEVEGQGEPSRGIDLHRLERLKGTEDRFQKFLGQPISQKLIADIGAEILAVYRSQGHPLINISTPPQDISDGALRIRVLEFTLGQVRVSGGDAATEAYVTRRVDLEPGQTIDTNDLAEDLDWLNRYAFRQVSVAFAPSKTPGQADITLQTATTRPWQVSAGYANSGSPQTSPDRYFIGAQAKVPGLPDAVASYQGTVSGDALQGGKVFSADSGLRYQSNGLSLLLPTLPRQALEVTVNDIQTNQPFEAFNANTAILEGSLAYRSALSGLGLDLSGELAVGLEARRSISKIEFDGLAINTARFDVYQAFLGYTWRGSTPIGASQIATTFHASPGDLTDDNTDLAYRAYSADRFGNASYAYATAGLTTLSPTFSGLGIDGLQVFNSLTAQYASKAMPTTEQMGLGGASAVRGYTLDDGAFDTGAVLRTELRHATSGVLGGDDSLASSLFVDLGYGRTNFTNEAFHAASVGAGVNYRLARYLTLSVDVAVPLQDLGNTRSGHARVQTWLAATF